MAKSDLWIEIKLFSNIWITFNILCSFATFFMIRTMKLNINGYLQIILTITVFQFHGIFI